MPRLLTVENKQNRKVDSVVGLRRNPVGEIWMHLFTLAVETVGSCRRAESIEGEGSVIGQKGDDIVCFARMQNYLNRLFMGKIEG